MISDDSSRSVKITRLVKDNDYDPVNELGNTYTIILWYEEGTNVDNYQVAVTGAKHQVFWNNDLRTVVVVVNETIGASGSIGIKCTPPASK